jgi:hypothetical protein
LGPQLVAQSIGIKALVTHQQNVFECIKQWRGGLDFIDLAGGHHRSHQSALTFDQGTKFGVEPSLGAPDSPASPGFKPMILPGSPGPGTVVDVKFPNPNAPAGTSVTDGGGKKLAGAQVHLIFWGDAWSKTPAPNPNINAIVNDAAGILGSVYLNAVSQYGAASAELGVVRVTTPGENPLGSIAQEISDELLERYRSVCWIDCIFGNERMGRASVLGG